MGLTCARRYVYADNARPEAHSSVWERPHAPAGTGAA